MTQHFLDKKIFDQATILVKSLHFSFIAMWRWKFKNQSDEAMNLRWEKIPFFKFLKIEIL